MRRLQLGPIETALAYMTSNNRITAHNFGDLFRFGLFAHFAMDRIEQRRRTNDRAARINAVRLHPIMIELSKNARSMLVNHACQAAVVRDDMGIKTMDQLLISSVAGMDRWLFGNA